jgi:transforming growth factor-beta-induced protein
MLKKKTLILLSALMLVLAACATDDGDAADTTEAATETTEAATETTEAATDTTAAMEEMGTIVDVATEAGNFTTLLEAAQVAGLVDTLSGEGPYTVFAPTDEAFAAVDPATLDALLADPEALADVLLYHVVPGEVYAADVVTLDSATTAQGSDVSITVDGDTVMINDATVTATDIQASNGVIHVIDSVLLPPTS